MSSAIIPASLYQPSFVGRVSEMLHGCAVIEHTCAGQGGVVLLAGEPGIGKTRMAEEFGRQATKAGAQVLWGRCYAGGNAPAFWPWVQILRAYLRSHDLKLLLGELPGDIANLARLVPELREHLSPSPPLLPAEDAQARFSLFISVTTLLVRAARMQPLVIILDDLQWADIPSLLLLQFLANDIHQAPMLMIGTYRDSDIEPDHPLVTTLAELSRVPGMHLIPLRGLDATDVARFVEAAIGRAPEIALVQAILNETGGNPFFLAEIARSLLQHNAQDTHALRIPLLPTVRSAIRQRLNRLSPSCNQILSRAAVIGRDFTLTRLVRLGDVAQDQVLNGLDEAIRGQLIERFSAHSWSTGRYRFVHDLVREAVYSELPSSERLQLHRQVGAMLEQLYAADPDAHLAELSYHFRQAAPLGEVCKAVSYTIQAAERSLRTLAYEEAARTYEQAIELLSMQEHPALEQHADVLLALGQAQMWSGDVVQAQHTYDRAAAMARRLADASRLAYAALGFAGNVVRPGVSDQQIVDRLTEALDTLSKTNAVLRVRLLARLAMEYRYSPWRERGEMLSRTALDAARSLDDSMTGNHEGRAALAYALNARHFAILAPDTLEERMAISLELARLAHTHNDRELLLQSLPWRVADLLTLGRVQATDEAIAEANRIAEEMRQPLYLWHAYVFRAMRAFMHGNWQEGEQLAHSGYQLGQHMQPGGADVYLAAQRFILCWEVDRLAEMEPVFATLMVRFPTLPVLQCFHALSLWHIGQAAAAQAELARLCANNAALLPRDQLWLGAVSVLAELAVLCREPAHAALLYELLLPHAERVVVVGVPICLGAAASYLGGLAALLGHNEAAIGHYRMGLAINEKLNILPFVVRTQARYAALLMIQESPDTLPVALDLLAQAEATAQRLGMRFLLNQIKLVRSAAAIAPAQQAQQQPAYPEAVKRGLTPRESEVLALIASGHSTKAIAAALVISVPTVERHITHIYAKLGISSRAEAIAIALRHGLA